MSDAHKTSDGTWIIKDIFLGESQVTDISIL